MTKGKLIVIEGTDCSGKETQTKLLIERLRKENIKVQNFSFPNYDSPTGKIIGGAYLGKPTIGESYFKENATNVDPKVAALYYAADRKYNIEYILDLLEKENNVILDRYIYSNMAHQGGKIKDKKARFEMYRWLEKLEFDLMELPKPDIAIFLHMPTDKATILKKDRKELPDAHERDINHLKHAEKAYIEISERYNFKTIECAYENIRAINDINDEIYDFVKGKLQNTKTKIKKK